MFFRTLSLAALISLLDAAPCDECRHCGYGAEDARYERERGDRLAQELETAVQKRNEMGRELETLRQIGNQSSHELKTLTRKLCESMRELKVVTQERDDSDAKLQSAAQEIGKLRLELESNVDGCAGLEKAIPSVYG